jgi:hypothetical protein
MVWNWNYISALKIAATVTAVKHGGVGSTPNRRFTPNLPHFGIDFMRKWQVQVRSVFVTLLDCCFILGVGFYCTV